MQSFWSKIYTEIRETLRDDAMFRAEMKKSSSSTHPSPALLELQYARVATWGPHSTKA